MLSLDADKTSLLDLAFDHRCRSSSTEFLHRAVGTSPALGCSQPRCSLKTISKVNCKISPPMHYLLPYSAGLFNIPCLCIGGLEARAASSHSGEHTQVIQQISNQGAAPSSASALAGFQLFAMLLQQLLQEIQLLRNKQHLQQRKRAQLILSFNNYSRMHAARLYGKSSCQCHKGSTHPSTTLKFW